MKVLFLPKRLFIFLSLIFSISTSLIAQRASFNGSDIPPNGQLRVLMVFIQINYDQNTPTVVPNYWPANTLPPNINDFFEPTPGANPNARVSRMLRDASFGNFEILGDFYNNLITVNQSSLNVLNEGNVINNAIQQINTSIQNNNFSTGSNLQLTQFDLTRAKDEGLFANAAPNGDIDMVMYFFRNFPNGEGGWVSPGSFNPIDNMQSDLISVMHGADWQLIRHEFMHMLFGGNNFHCAGGQHNHPNTGANYFGSLQNGYGLMGDERSSFMTCNAWDRDRLNWFHPDRENEIQNDPNLSIIPNQHNIFCHDNTGTNSSSIESDLDPANPNDAGIYWLYDFMTTGDAIRIRLPFFDPANEFEQWLWIENHQTNARNNNFLDDFNHVGLGSNCKSNATPGIYAYV